MVKQFQLSDQSIIGFVATSDPDQAKKFYRDTLGLPLVSEEMPFALVFDAHGTMLRVTVVERVVSAGYTVLGWQVPNIVAAAKALSQGCMVLNEMVYDPNGSNNSSLLSLVAGTITFVAGETAKHGDMKIDTPVATMGIRGTAVLVEIDFTVPGQGGTPDAKFQVLVEPDGTTGSYILFDKTTLTPIAVVDQAGQQINIRTAS